MFEGHIMVEFKFNVLDVLSQHLKVQNAVILSFNPNGIVVQTSSECDSDIKGFYTTTIPFDCNRSEVNVMITKSLIGSTKSAGGCKAISVISNESMLKGTKIEPSTVPLVEVSFDLYTRRPNSKPANKPNSRFDRKLNGRLNEMFGRLVKEPYLHYLITSRIDYKIDHYKHVFKYESIVVRKPISFKRQYGLESRIFMAKNGTTLFCCCHHFPEYDTIIQPDNVVERYDSEDDDYQFDYELPNKIFKHLFKFIGQLINKSKDVVTNNFEILIRDCDKGLYSQPVDDEEPIMIKAGGITFSLKGGVRRQVKEEIAARRRKMIERNFDRRDDWSNVKLHCHSLVEHNEGPMPIPEFRINHKYYSTHATYRDFEPLRAWEHLKLDDDDEIDTPSRESKALDCITRMIEDGTIVTQDDAFRKLKELAPEIYKLHMEGEITLVYKL